jgi:hypothetical protein
MFIGNGLAESSDLSEDDSTDSEYDEDYSLPDSGSEVLDEIKKDPQFIASRGSFSEVSDDYADFFSNPVYLCWSSITEIDQFFTEFNDLVIGSSYAGAGYMIVELESDSSEKVNEAAIDEIYQIIDEYCEQESISEVPVVFMWSHIEEDLPLPDYGPQIFEEIKNEPGFIATRGTMPVITDASEKVEWEETAGDCIHSFRDELDPYMLENGGPLVGYGYDYRGYIFVEFDKKSPEKVNKSIIDEIYLIIDDHCEQEGVSAPPVVFEWGEVPIEDEELLPEDEIPDVDESDGANLAGNEEEIAGNETANQTSGFTSIMLVLCLLFLVKTRK